MILQTMNDEEKTFEVFRVHDCIFQIAREEEEAIIDRFRRGNRFPYFNRIAWTDDKANKWYITFMCKSKKDAKIGKFYILAYTIYEIQKKGKTEKGIIGFDPYAMKRRVNSDSTGAVFWDFVPHAFDRYTERYLKPRDLQDIEFMAKVENIISRWWHFDIEGDKSSKKHTDKGFCPYDIYMHGGGMFRGTFVSNLLIRFFTYVADDMLFKEQRERQTKINRERFKFKKDGVY